MYMHASRIHQCHISNKDDNSKLYQKGKINCFLSILEEPFTPFVETSQTPWHVLEQYYYLRNQERIEEELNPWKKVTVDILVMLKDQVCCITAALHRSRKGSKEGVGGSDLCAHS